MKFNSTLKSLVLTLLGSTVHADIISGTKTVVDTPTPTLTPSPEPVHPGKALSAQCFENGGNEYYYDFAPGSTDSVCFKHYATDSEDLWEIIQSDFPECPVGTKGYSEVMVNCYNHLLYWKGMFYSSDTGVIEEFGPYRTKTTSKTTTKTTSTFKTKTIPIPSFKTTTTTTTFKTQTKTVTSTRKSTKTIPTSIPKSIPTHRPDPHHNPCSTKALGAVRINSAKCFKSGGNEYYHNFNARICNPPSGVCIHRSEEFIEIIHSDLYDCPEGDKQIAGKSQSSCEKLIRKWNKVTPETEI